MKATLAALVASLLTLLPGCASAPQPVVTASGLQYEVVRAGAGPMARAGQQADPRDHLPARRAHPIQHPRAGATAALPAGRRQVIDGVDEAVTGMRVGEQRRLVVAPHLSRRSSYPAGLSPNDTLHYELELVAIESPQEPAHGSTVKRVRVRGSANGLESGPAPGLPNLHNVRPVSTLAWHARNRTKGPARLDRLDRDDGSARRRP